jgi:hypothetical protein
MPVFDKHYCLTAERIVDILNSHRLGASLTEAHADDEEDAERLDLIG